MAWIANLFFPLFQACWWMPSLLPIIYFLDRLLVHATKRGTSPFSLTLSYLPLNIFYFVCVCFFKIMSLESQIDSCSLSFSYQLVCPLQCSLSLWHCTKVCSLEIIRKGNKDPPDVIQEPFEWSLSDYRWSVGR